MDDAPIPPPDPTDVPTPTLEPATAVESAAEQLVLARIAAADERSRFGPSFFLGRLRALVREQCPDPNETLPSVRLHLGMGDALDVCHVVGVGPSWVALAVADDDVRGHLMRTELVPYELVVRVTIRSMRPSEARLGFSDRHAPLVTESDGTHRAEDALRLVAGELDLRPRSRAVV